MMSRKEKAQKLRNPPLPLACRSLTAGDARDGIAARIKRRRTEPSCQSFAHHGAKTSMFIASRTYIT